MSDYRQVGWKLGRWVDVGLWQAELREVVGEPGDPRMFMDMRVPRPGA